MQILNTYRQFSNSNKPGLLFFLYCVIREEQILGITLASSLHFRFHFPLNKQLISRVMTQMTKHTAKCKILILKKINKSIGRKNVPQGKSNTSISSSIPHIFCLNVTQTNDTQVNTGITPQNPHSLKHLNATWQRTKRRAVHYLSL